MSKLHFLVFIILPMSAVLIAYFTFQSVRNTIGFFMFNALFLAFYASSIAYKYRKRKIISNLSSKDDKISFFNKIDLLLIPLTPLVFIIYIMYLMASSNNYYPNQSGGVGNINQLEEAIASTENELRSFSSLSKQGSNPTVVTKSQYPLFKPDLNSDTTVKTRFLNAAFANLKNDLFAKLSSEELEIVKESLTSISPLLMSSN